jgi:hypothetical protein
MDKKVNAATKSDLRLVAKSELTELSDQLAVAIPKTADKMTKLHLMETRTDIKKILDNKYSTPGTAQTFSIFDLLGVKAKVEHNPLNCWGHDLLDPDLRKELEAEKAASSK